MSGHPHDRRPNQILKQNEKDRQSNDQQERIEDVEKTHVPFHDKQQDSQEQGKQKRY
jgi:hypothetical protein